MATTFLEPGGDADFAIATTSGFWGSISGSPSLATDFVHGSHIKSISYPTSALSRVYTKIGAASDAGTRLSFYLYINAKPNATADIVQIYQSSFANEIFAISLSSAGVIILNKPGTNFGTGPTLNTGQWYRIAVAWTITSSTVNRFELFVNKVPSLSLTNVTLPNTGTSTIAFGNPASNSTLDIRTSDHYVDNSSALTDPGDIWVTAKRPVANGTTNGFTTQIGTGGSGYGTGHSPQVNERPASTANGWSMVGAGGAITEEYNIESKQTGDISIPNRIIDYLGWAYMSSLAGETVQLIVNGTNNSQAITSTPTMYTKVAGSTTYPAGTGTDIGITTDTSLTTVSLYECGILVAFLPATIGPFPTHFRG